MPLNIDWKQILLHIFNFVLLFAILFFLLYKPVKKFMDKRVQYYKDIDDDTKKRSDEAEEMKKLYEEKLSTVETEIEEKRRLSNELAEKERQEKISSAKKEAEKILGNARAEGKAEKKRIIDEAQGEIVDMVTEACKKAVSSHPSDAMDGFLSQVNED